MSAGWKLLGAPLDSSGASRGEERAPEALRRAGLAQAFGAMDTGDATAPLRDSQRDPESGLIAHAPLRRASGELADRVAAVFAAGDRPLVAGGDCCLLIGALAGTRRARGRVALWFVDGHADYWDGRSSPTGEAADTELAIVTGAEPRDLAGMGDRVPMVDPSDVVVLGHRPPELDPDVAAELERVPGSIRTMSAGEIIEAGPGRVGERWEREWEGTAAWLHLDLDVLDETEFPAVTYPQSHGLGWDSLTDLIRPLLASDDLAGVSVADLNPDLDPDGRHARRVVETLRAASP